MASTLNLLRRLNEQGVEYVVIGGVAAVAHGSARVTFDLDLCAPVDLPNVQKIVRAVSDLNPRIRTRPDLPAVTPDDPRLVGVKNLYLMTGEGPLDVLGEVSGLGDFSAVVRDAVVMDFQGVLCRVLELDALIRSKRAVGRSKDLSAVPELEALKELRREPPGQSPTDPTLGGT